MKKEKVLILFVALAISLVACSRIQEERKYRESGVPISQESSATETLASTEVTTETFVGSREIEDLGLTVTETKDAKGYLTVTIEKNNSIFAHKLMSSWTYNIEEIDPNRIFFSEMGDHGTEVHIWIPYVLDADTLQEETDMIEDPLVFLDEYLIQRIEDERIIVEFNGQEYEFSFYTDPTGNTDDTIDYGQQIEYMVRNQQIICEVGLYQGLGYRRAYIDFPYVYQDGKYMIDLENTVLTCDED